MTKLIIISTGGTIDKDYGVGKGIYDVEPGKPVALEILNKNNVNIKIELIELLKKDSLDMTDEDRQKIKQTVLNVENDKIMITHGTDTMIETGKVLQDIKDKVIVLVGAARPYAMKDTDAEFNVGYALAVVQLLAEMKKYGVYIAMNGQVFDIDNVEKGEDGIFRKKIIRNKDFCS